MKASYENKNLLGREEAIREFVSFIQEEELRDALDRIRKDQKLTFLEIKVSLGSRSDLGRPKETAAENKNDFMKYINLIM